MDHRIWHKKVPDFKLVGFTDSDWAGCLDDRKSTSGYIFFLGSAPISWCSKKQVVVALSSSEAEYIAVTGAACQAVWLRRLLADLVQVQEGFNEIFCDNETTISMTNNSVFHSRTKHIDIRSHFICNLVNDKDIVLEYCNMNQEVADALKKSMSLWQKKKKKSMSQAKHHFFKSQMGVANI